MIGGLVAKVLGTMTGIKVVHSIPGRLRIHLSGMKKAQQYLKSRQDIPQHILLYKLKGIQSFELNPLTSRALIIYDKDALSEKEIMRWLKRLQEAIIQTALGGETSINQTVIEQIAAQLKEEGYEMEKFEQSTLT